MISVRMAALAGAVAATLFFSPPASAGDTEDNVGAGSGNQVEGSVDSPLSVECNAAALLGSATAACVKTKGGPAPTPTPTPTPTPETPTTSAPATTTPAGSPAPTEEGSLPRTGANVGWALLLGSSVLIAGIALRRWAVKRAA